MSHVGREVARIEAGHVGRCVARIEAETTATIVEARIVDEQSGGTGASSSSSQWPRLPVNGLGPNQRGGGVASSAPSRPLGIGPRIPANRYSGPPLREATMPRTLEAMAYQHGWHGPTQTQTNQARRTDQARQIRNTEMVWPVVWRRALRAERGMDDDWGKPT